MWIIGYTAEVAGSVGAYGAILHDGSEYTGNYVDHMTPQVYFYQGLKNVSLIEISPVYWYHWPVDNNQEYVFIRSHSSELIASYWSCSISKQSLVFLKIKN